jgi:hypothetical protein
VQRIGALLEISNQMAERATITLEMKIDAHLRGDGRFAVPGLEIRAHLSNGDEWGIYERWLSAVDPSHFEASARLGRRRRLLRKRPDWTPVIAARPALPYRVHLLVASDIPSKAPQTVPWTEVSLGSPPTAGTATLTTE